MPGRPGPPGAPPPPGLGLPKGPRYRQLHWAKLPARELDGSVWTRRPVAPAFDPLEVFKRCDILFKASAAKQLLGGGKPSRPRVMDPNRQNMVGICLSKIRMPPAMIKRDILLLEGPAAAPDSLVSLQKCVPQQHEEAAVAALAELPDRESLALSEAERYFLEVISVPRLGPRLKAAAARASMLGDVANARAGLQSMQAASRCLLTNRRFAELLHVLLRLGNHLNMGTNNGDARGFRVLSTLGKLSDLKAVGTAAKATLLDYLVEVLDAHLPHLLALPEDLAPVTAVSRVDYDHLRMEVDRLQGCLEVVASELQYARLRSRNGGERPFVGIDTRGPRPRVRVYADGFARVVGPFSEEAAREVASLHGALAELNAVFPEVIVYFGETVDGCSPNDVLHGVARFLGQLSDAKERLLQRKAKGDPLLPLAAAAAPAADEPPKWRSRRGFRSLPGTRSPSPRGERPSDPGPRRNPPPVSPIRES